MAFNDQKKQQQEGDQTELRGWLATGELDLVLTYDIGEDFSGAVTPAMELYIQRGIARADQMGVDLVVFELNTPGGQVDIMNNIVQDIRASKVPVAVYVSPRGAMAASAGALIHRASTGWSQPSWV